MRGPAVDSSIFLFLVQDGVINGAIYALVAVAIVLVFAVTRILFIPQGEFVAFGALTLTAFEAGHVPGIAALLPVLGVVAAALELWRRRSDLDARQVGRVLAADVALPGALGGLAVLIAPLQLGATVNILMTLALVIPLGPLVYRIAFRPLAEASVLVLFITAVGVHLVLVALGLLFFGPEGYRATPVSEAAFEAGPMLISGQSIAVVVAAAALFLALYVFFDRTLTGKALKASAVNRRGALLVGIPTALSGRIAFALAAAIGALSGILVAPITTIYYDTGFIIGLKGFVAAILGGLGSYPATATAAILVGLVESFSSFFASSFKEVIVFTIILPVLFWRSLTAPHVEDEE